jgi:hypothetical protein
MLIEKSLKSFAPSEDLRVLCVLSSDISLEIG